MKIEGDNLEALELRGKAYYILGEIDTAVSHFRKALVFDPEHAECKHMYRVIKKITDSEKKYEKAKQKNDHEDAIKWLLKMIEADKQHNTIVPKAKVNLGKSYRALKKYKDAAAVLEEVVKVLINIFSCNFYLSISTYCDIS